MIILTCINRSQHRTRLDEDLKGFKAPWEYPKPPAPRNTFAAQSNVKPPVKPKPKGRPLLWCPSPDAATHVRIKSSSAASHSNSSPDCQWNTRGNFRRLKHTPTFVDESLFGPRLQEPTFEAPWNERKKGEKRPVRPYLFDPSGGNSFENGHTVVKKRPSTALGLSRKEMRKQQASGNQRQVWKP